MLNSKKERELCYFVTIDEIKPIEGADRVEVAVAAGKLWLEKDSLKREILLFILKLIVKFQRKHLLIF